MNNIFRYTFLLLALLSIIACSREGCTDPASDNYDVDANIDDGSCVDPWIKFLGEYTGADYCENGEDRSDAITITISSPESNIIHITNETLGFSINGVVLGQAFIFSDSIIIQDLDVVMAGKGTYSRINGQNQIELCYTLNETVACQGVWTEQ